MSATTPTFFQVFAHTCLMDKIVEFNQLELEWRLARKATNEAQLAIDSKMNAFLAGTSPAPSRKELEHVDDLRCIECEKRGLLDEFICEFAG